MGCLKDELTGTISRKEIDRIVAKVVSHTSYFDELYSLTRDKDEQIAWHAIWACEKLCKQKPSLYKNKVNELIQQCMQCKKDGARRLLLNILLQLPVEEPIHVEFLDFCLQRMVSPSETAGVQAVSMKMAYKLCQEKGELLNELQLYLENMEPTYYTAAVQNARIHLLKSIQKNRK